MAATKTQHSTFRRFFFYYFQYGNICSNTIVLYCTMYSAYFGSLKIWSILLCISFFFIKNYTLHLFNGRSDWHCRSNTSLVTGTPSVILLQEFFMLIFISVYPWQTDVCRLYLPHINVDFLVFIIGVVSLWMIRKRRDHSKCYTDSGIVPMRQYYENCMWLRFTKPATLSHTWSGSCVAHATNWFTANRVKNYS